MSTPLSERVQILLARRQPFTESEVRDLQRENPELVVFLVLEQSRRMREFEFQSAAPITPSTPSGMIPPYQKPPMPRIL